jgi:predicted HicB family RNase H-like nuclease
MTSIKPPRETKAAFVRMPPDLKTRLDQTAKDRGVSLNALMLQACWEWLERHGKEAK